MPMCPIAPLCDGAKRPGSRSRRLPGLTRGESYEEVLATLQCSLSLFGSTHPAFDHRGDTLAHNSGLPMTNGDRKGILLRTLADVQAALAQAQWKNPDAALGDHRHLEITWKTSSRRLLKQDETSVEHSSRTSRPTHEGKKNAAGCSQGPAAKGEPIQSGGSTGSARVCRSYASQKIGKVVFQYACVPRNPRQIASAQHPRNRIALSAFSATASGPCSKIPPRMPGERNPSSRHTPRGGGFFFPDAT